MTRTLPPKPDIQHLRKEAKQLFARLQHQAPQAHLADAQFILAAEYGFKSWSRLKSEVERRAAERWKARLAAQESFQPFPVESFRTPAPSLQRLWLSRQDALTQDEDDSPPDNFLHAAGLQLAFLMLALSLALLTLR